MVHLKRNRYSSFTVAGYFYVKWSIVYQVKKHIQQLFCMKHKKRSKNKTKNFNQYAGYNWYRDLMENTQFSP